MALYPLLAIVHVLAAMLWLGHMFVWSLVSGPAMRRIEPAATAELLRERSLFLGALGWPALAILVPTGIYLLHMRGVDPAEIVRLGFLDRPDGHAILVKLLLVLWMIVYQIVWGHRRAPVAVYVNMLAALVILGASVVIVRGWA